MDHTQTRRLRISSARRELTRSISERTGLDQAILTDLVHDTYGKIRADAVLGPVFLVVGCLDDRGVSRRSGSRARASAGDMGTFRTLFRESAETVCTPTGSAHVIERAERIARALNMTVEDATHTGSQTVPTLR